MDGGCLDRWVWALPYALARGALAEHSIERAAATARARAPSSARVLGVRLEATVARIGARAAYPPNA